MCTHGSFLFLTVSRDVNFILQFVPVWGLQVSCRILIRGENSTAATILNVYLEETPIITLTSFGLYPRPPAVQHSLAPEMSVSHLTQLLRSLLCPSLFPLSPSTNTFMGSSLQLLFFSYIFRSSQSQAQSLPNSYIPHLYLLSNNIKAPSDVPSSSFLCYCAVCFSLCSLFKVWRIFLEFVFIHHVTFLISSSSSLNLYWFFIKPNKSFFSSILMNVHLRTSFSPPFTLHHHVFFLVPPCLLCI